MNTKIPPNDTTVKKHSRKTTIFNTSLGKDYRYLYQHLNIDDIDYIKEKPKHKRDKIDTTDIKDSIDSHDTNESIDSTDSHDINDTNDSTESIDTNDSNDSTDSIDSINE